MAERPELIVKSRVTDASEPALTSSTTLKLDPNRTNARVDKKLPPVIRRLIETADPNLPKEEADKELPSDEAPSTLKPSEPEVRKLPARESPEPNLAHALTERELPSNALFHTERSAPSLAADHTDIELPSLATLERDKQLPREEALSTDKSEPIREAL